MAAPQPWKRFLPVAGNALSDLGYGISQGGFKKGFGIAAKRGQDMQGYRDQQRQLQKSESEQAATKSATLDWVQKELAANPDNPDYQLIAQGLQIGALDAGGAFNAVLKAKAAPEPVKGIEINGRLVNPLTGAEMGNFSDPAEQDYPSSYDEFQLTQQDPAFGAFLNQGKAPVAPNGYRYGQDGTTLEFIPGGPADPSTAGKTTEATRRNQQLASVIAPELESLIPSDGSAGTFDALANGFDQAKGVLGPAGMMDPTGLTRPSADYQQAQNSLKTIVASYLYSVSGATANPGEVANQVAVLTPVMGESAESVNAKKARLVQMVEAVKAAATGTPISIAPGGSFVYNPTTGELEPE